MLSLRKPPDDAVRRFIAGQFALPFTYPEVGLTRNWAREAVPPPGYHGHQARARLGTGERTYAAAVEALRRWRQFDVGWSDLFPADAPPEPGRIVAVRARVLGFWTLHACRVIYRIDEPAGPVARSGFGYGTLPGHGETGEERFLVEWDRGTDEVFYEVSAFVRPRHPLVRAASSYATRLADRFRLDSAAALRRALQAA